MKETSKLAWGVAAGVVLGAIATSAIGRGKLRPCASKMLSYAYDFKDKSVECIESIKEDCEDIAAEAKERSEVRKASKQQAEQNKPQDDDIVAPKA